MKAGAWVLPTSTTSGLSERRGSWSAGRPGRPTTAPRSRGSSRGSPSRRSSSGSRGLPAGVSVPTSQTRISAPSASEGRCLADGTAGEHDRRGAEERRGPERLLHCLPSFSLGVRGGRATASGCCGAGVTRGAQRDPELSGQDHDGRAAQDDVLAVLGHPHRGRPWNSASVRVRRVSTVASRERSVEQVGGTAEHDLREVERADDRCERDAEPLARRRAGSRRAVSARMLSLEARGRARGTASQASRQPTLPHDARGPPSVPTTTWPISPAAKRRADAWAGRRRSARRRHRGRP